MFARTAVVGLLTCSLFVAVSAPVGAADTGAAVVDAAPAVVSSPQRAGLDAGQLQALADRFQETTSAAGVSSQAEYRRSQISFADVRWTDMCDDAGGSRVDIRRAGFVEDNFGDRLIYGETCRRWTPASSSEMLLWYILVPYGRSDGPDYLASISRDGGGSLTLLVFRTPSNDPSTWYLTYDGAASSYDDGYVMAASLPGHALDYNSQFAFWVESSHDGSTVADDLPGVAEEVAVYPWRSCDIAFFDQRTVHTEPGQLDAAVAAAEAAGLAVSSVSPQLGTFAVRGAAASVQRLPGVALVEPVASMQQQAMTPSESAYTKQWSLPQASAPAAWDVRVGSRLTIAVVDDGVDASRPDFSGRVLAGRDTAYDLSLPAGNNSDRGGHGTAVAGVAAAQGNNSTEIVGVDWNARILPVRVTDAGSCIKDAALAAGIAWAVDAGADVINVSLGGAQDTSALRAAVAYAAQHDVVVVAASGNSASSTKHYPASYDTVISVGAVDRQGGVTSYSTYNDKVDLVAGGGADESDSGGIWTLQERDTLGPIAGTSFSSPLVAGAAALYRAQWPDATAADVAAALTTSARDIGASGYDPKAGHGLLDIASLLSVQPAGAGSPPAPDPGSEVTADPYSRDIDDACPAGMPPEDGLSDVDYQEDTVDCVVWWQLAAGIGDGKYGPDRPVTRGQMATFLVRLLEQSGIVLPPGNDGTFSDVTSGTHKDAIERLAAAGVVSGRQDGTYGPAEPVTRAQMATFLARTGEQHLGSSLATSDVYFPDVAGTHAARVNAIASVGITAGNADGTYGPAASVTRIQMAVFLARLLDYLVEDGGAVRPDLLGWYRIDAIDGTQLTVTNLTEQPASIAGWRLYAVAGGPIAHVTADTPEIAAGETATVTLDLDPADGAKPGLFVLRDDLDRNLDNQPT